MADANTLAIDVWQFVRIMVALEKSARRGRGPSAAYTAWREIWRELDQRLTELGKSDAAGFAELMMEQQVVLPIARPAIIREAVECIEAVTRQMTTDLDRGTGDAGHQSDLRFERKELNALARKIAGRGGRDPAKSLTQNASRRRPDNHQKNKH